jgi:hypothetical protein
MKIKSIVLTFGLVTFALCVILYAIYSQLRKNTYFLDKQEYISDVEVKILRFQPYVLKTTQENSNIYMWVAYLGPKGKPYIKKLWVNGNLNSKQLSPIYYLEKGNYLDISNANQLSKLAPLGSRLSLAYTDGTTNQEFATQFLNNETPLCIRDSRTCNIIKMAQDESKAISVFNTTGEISNTTKFPVLFINKVVTK